MDQVRLIVVAAPCRGPGPIHVRLLSDGSNHALKGAEPGEQFGRQSNTAIELAQQMFVTDPDRVRDLANPRRVQSTLDHAQGVTDRARRMRSGSDAMDKPRFQQIE